MSVDDRFFITVDADDIGVLPRPRLSGSDTRRPDFSQVGFQAALSRSFVDVPVEPFSHCVMTVSVPHDDSLPLVATLKSIIDATVAAGVIADDRSSINGARINRYRLEGNAQPTVNVEVLPRRSGDPAFIRSFPDEQGLATVMRSVISPVSYRYRCGVDGDSPFSNPWVNSSEDYEQLLRDRWRVLQDSGAIHMVNGWLPFMSPCMLVVGLPDSATCDPDNALLFLIDMLEVARRDELGDQAGELTLDQLLTAAWFYRSDGSGFSLSGESFTPSNQYECNAYFTRLGERIDPYIPGDT